MIFRTIQGGSLPGSFPFEVSAITDQTLLYSSPWDPYSMEFAGGIGSLGSNWISETNSGIELKLVSRLWLIQFKTIWVLISCFDIMINAHTWANDNPIKFIRAMFHSTVWEPCTLGIRSPWNASPFCFGNYAIFELIVRAGDMKSIFRRDETSTVTD